MRQVVTAGLEAASGTAGWQISLVGGSRRQQRPEGEAQPVGRPHHDAGRCRCCQGVRLAAGCLLQASRCWCGPQRATPKLDSSSSPTLYPLFMCPQILW